MTHHGRGLFRLTKNQALVDQIKQDFCRAEISEKDLAMLAYAEKLTREPCECGRGDVVGLRKVGFEDADILDIVQVCAYYNFVNRMACGLGVELEPHWAEAGAQDGN